MMNFYNKTICSNLFEQKFSKSSNLISNNILFEIKFEDLENLSDEAVLKSFYFFFLLFNRLPAFRNFSSRYHLGKTFYNFNVSITLETFSFAYFVSSFFEFYTAEPNKINFDSKVFASLATVRLTDLKIFSIVESNPHFFKWDRELKILFYPGAKYFTPTSKFFKIYFWNLNTLKIQNLDNIWNYYVS